MDKLSLDGCWRLYVIPDADASPTTSCTTERELLDGGFLSVEATVPGNYELDLQAAGQQEDLFFGMNVLKAQQSEDCHLWYCRHFNWEKSVDDLWLNFEGIDTFGDIFLNGQQIGHTDNMLIPYEFPASSLRQGKNELLVHISPCLLEAQKAVVEAGSFMFQPYNIESLSVRKAAHMYGWDIMPRILSGGIWRPVFLYRKKNIRLDDLYLYTVEAKESRALIWGYYRICMDRPVRELTLKIRGECYESRFSWEEKLRHTEGKASISIPSPHLWWPKDMGSPDLYMVQAELWDGDKLVDSREIRLGIRTVRLERSSIIDENGDGKFCFYVNGEPLFVRGTNWVPLDAFHSRDVDRLPAALALLEDSGCNMVRCWGGNVYENHAFFDYCDTHGIAVWQDFCMGCAAYPQDDNMCAKIAYEVETVVRKLRGHASIFLWAGDNECDEVVTVWSPMKRDPNLNRLTRKVIPEVLMRLDPARPYLPSSPYIDEVAFESGKITRIPERHLWGPRDYYKGSYYTDSVAKFASETGYHGCPAPASVSKFISGKNVWPWENNPEWLAHATCMNPMPGAPYSNRIRLMANQVTTLFGEAPDTLEMFAFASQISQAEAVKFFIERFRSGKWERTGIIWWNLLDGWPQFSDAVVDYYFNKKLAFTYIKRSQLPICLMFREPEQDMLTLVGINEYRDIRNISYRVTDVERNEVVLDGKVSLAPNKGMDIAGLHCPLDVRFYLIEWEENGQSYRNHYLCGKPPFDLYWYIQMASRSGLLEAEGFSAKFKKKYLSL